jgi:hypothetical protein
MTRHWTLTPTELGSVPDDELIQKVIHSVLEYIGELGPGEDDYELVRRTPKPAQFFWAMRLLESEVNNGGFEQYFWNSSSALSDVALDAYLAIGADKYVDFLKRALGVMENDSSATRRKRFANDWPAYRKACPPILDALDNEFYSAGCGSPDSGGRDTNLDRMKIEYIRRNANLICIP